MEGSCLDEAEKWPGQGWSGGNQQLRCSGCFLSTQHCAEYPGPVILFNLLFGLMTLVPISPSFYKKGTRARRGKGSCLRLHSYV